MPISSVIGLQKAVEYIENIGLEYISEYIDKLHRYAIASLKQIEGVKIYNPT
jgi:selenocysteine lyase/cysteine desulfurase